MLFNLINILPWGSDLPKEKRIVRTFIIGNICYIASYFLLSIDFLWSNPLINGIINVIRQYFLGVFMADLSLLYVLNRQYFGLQNFKSQLMNLFGSNTKPQGNSPFLIDQNQDRAHRDRKNPQDPQDLHHPQDPQDPHHPRDPQDPQDPQDSQEPQDPHNPRDQQDPQEPQNLQNPEHSNPFKTKKASVEITDLTKSNELSGHIAEDQNKSVETVKPEIDAKSNSVNPVTEPEPSSQNNQNLTLTQENLKKYLANREKLNIDTTIQSMDLNLD